MGGMPRSCAGPADCTTACPPGLGCTCGNSPMGMICVPACEVDRLLEDPQRDLILRARGRLRAGHGARDGTWGVWGRLALALVCAACEGAPPGAAGGDAGVTRG
ncbi:MAG: hypothetical protein R3F43_10990 [bacterium]